MSSAPTRLSTCRCPNSPPAASAIAILRRSADGARKDVLSWGEPAGGGPYVMVEIYRPGAASERFIDAPSEIAARIVGFTVTDDVKPAGADRRQIRPCAARRFRHRRAGYA